MNKKALAMEMIVWIIFISVCFILITGLIYQAFSKANEKSAEIICRSSVALREKATLTDKDVGDVPGLNLQTKLAPLLCKTIDKKVPKEGSNKEQALKEFSDLIARCWWQFLEGTSKNTFGMAGAWDYAATDKCFVCYTVSLSTSFTGEELRDAVDSNPYKIDDGSDSCTIDGRGKCELGKTCEQGVVYEGGSCETGKVCCVTDNMCEDKGGKCMDGCDTKYSREYPLWKCEDKKCCLNPKFIMSYADYVESNNGAGYIAIDRNMDFDRKRDYAITYVAESESISAVDQFVADYLNLRNIKKHRVLVSTLDEVTDNDKCVVQTGTGGE